MQQAQPTQQQDAVTRVGKMLTNYHIPPSKMAKQLNDVYFNMVRTSPIAKELEDIDQMEIDETFYILIDCLHELDSVRRLQ